MFELFARTLSQGLQAFMPVALAVAWLRAHRQASALVSVRRAVIVAMPLTVLAGWLFQTTSYQSQSQSLLAIAAGALAAAIGWRLSRRLRRGPDAAAIGPDRAVWQVALGATIALLIVRQAMEIAAVFGAAAIQVRSLDASLVIAAGAALALAAACGWVLAASRLPDRAVISATKAFAVLFLVQIALYAFHKGAEARFLPSGEVLDAATEPYGPDSSFGYRISWLLVGVPLAAALWNVVTRRAAGAGGIANRWSFGSRRIALAACGTIAAVLVVLAGMKTRERALVPAVEAAPLTVEATSLASSPHVLFRDTGSFKDYGVLSLAPLSTPGASRAAASLHCDRVSFAAGQGICLAADRGVQTTYKAIIFDRRFQPLASFALDGSPSRTRISPDGRVGAITVFLAGQVHGYASAAVSTRTTLIDMASHDVLADLETFATWRDGTRFAAADFNFWGVTFARDSNAFYATLQTGGKTYLVRGDLGLRKLTVLHENVECPSLSPDNHLIAYKKRVGGNLAPWRLYILELATMTERPVEGETRSIDDQIEWLDDAHVLYGTRQSSESAITNVWIAAVDGKEPARVFLPAGESPIIVR